MAIEAVMNGIVANLKSFVHKYTKPKMNIAPNIAPPKMPIDTRM